MTKYLSYSEFIKLNEGYGGTPETDKLVEVLKIIFIKYLNIRYSNYRLSFLLLNSVNPKDNILKDNTFHLPDCGYTFVSKDGKYRYFFTYTKPFSIFKSKYDDRNNQLSFDNMKNQLKNFEEIDLKDSDVFSSKMISEINEEIDKLSLTFKNIKNWSSLKIHE